MKQFIATILMANTYGYLSCAPKRTLSCDNASVEGLEWMTPYVVNGRMEGYRRVIQKDKPSADSIKTLRLKVDGQTYWIVVQDSDTEAVFADTCNKCCQDGTPEVTAAYIPEPIIEDEACVDADGKRRFLAPLPTLIAGQELTLNGLSSINGGTYFAGDITNHTTQAALVAELNAKHADLGVFDIVPSASGNYLRLASATVVSALLLPALTIQNKFLQNLTFPQTLKSVTHNGVKSNTAPVVVTNVSELIAAVAKYFADGKLGAINGTTVSYDGTGVPANVEFNSGVKAFA